VEVTRPAAGLAPLNQCEGCTFNTGHALELSYLHWHGAPTVSPRLSSGCCYEPGSPGSEPRRKGRQVTEKVATDPLPAAAHHDDRH
jgi:hypothetical protein